MLNGTHVTNELFIGWFANEDQARGNWLKVAMEKHPYGSLNSYKVDDITYISQHPPEVTS